MNPLSVSILIPTHNRCDILAQTLESLRELRMVAGVDTELVVVANACSDATERVVTEAAGQLPMAVRCVVEETAGLSRARNTAVAKARYEILAFLDDDVLVEPQWLEALVDIYRNYPADLVGGKVLLWWKDVERPQWLDDRVDGLLSRLDHGEQVREVSGVAAAIGANFSFRRQVFERIGGFRLDLGRIGNQLLATEEGEFFQRAFAIGYRMFYAPKSLVYHYVAPHRVTVEYLRQVAYGQGLSQILMKSRMGSYAWTRSIVGHSYLLVRHGLGLVISKLSGSMHNRVFHQVRISIACGGLAGLWRRAVGGNKT